MEYADSVLGVSIDANKRIIEEWKGDERMCQALMEIMEPELAAIRKEERAEGIREGIKEGKAEGIRGTVKTLRDFGQKDEEIKPAIIKTYGLTTKEADEFMKNGREGYLEQEVR